MTHAFTFDAQISLFIPELMQKAKNNVDPTKYFGIVITQIQHFKFACDFKIG